MFLVLGLALPAVACRSRAPEPEPTPIRSSAPSDGPSLEWDAPASWTLEKSAEKGLYRAKYLVPAQGNAPNPAEVLVSRIGDGEASALDAPLEDLRAEFEGPEVAKAVRRARAVRGFELRELEVAGSYKFPMGPRLKKRAVAQVIKEHWRGIGVGARAPNGDLWFFRLVGPEDAVQAARSPFLSMLESLAVPGPKSP